LLIVGGAVGKFQLSRQALSLLNDNIDLDVIRQYTNKKDVVFLVEQLKNNVKIIQPVTYLEPFEAPQQGK